MPWEEPGHQDLPVRALRRGAVFMSNTPGMLRHMDDDPGQPISYEVLQAGTPVFSADGELVGHVTHVLSVPEKDVFDGIVIDEREGSGGHRFADADDVDSIHERAVTLKLDAAACDSLPKPSANPAIMVDDPADSSSRLSNKLRRAWDMVSGNY